jgi:hypothetical protein
VPENPFNACHNRAKMTSTLKIESNRIAGASSHSAVTLRGKPADARNATPPADN